MPDNIINGIRNALADFAGVLGKNTKEVVDKLGELKDHEAIVVKKNGELVIQNQNELVKELRAVGSAVKNQEVAESVTIKNPEAITGDLKKGLQGIIEALQTELKNFDKNIVVKNDFSNFASLFKTSQDKSSVIKALKQIEDKLDKEEKEETDYTMILSDIAKAVEDKEAVKVLKEILAKDFNFEFPAVMPIDLDPNLIENDRVKVVLRDDQVAKMTATQGGDKNMRIVDEDGTKADVIATDGYNGLVTTTPGHVSAANSTSTPLLADAVFTGDWEDITNYGVIVISLTSDVDSAIDGLCVQFSSDGTVAGIVTDDAYSTFSNLPKTFSFQAAAQKFRVLFTNGGSDQTTFNMQTVLKPYYVKPSSHRINDAIVGEDDSELVKSVLTGEDPDGIFRNVEVSISKALKTSIEDGQTGRRAEVEPLGALKVETPVRLVGTTFSNGTKDPNFWAETVTGSGSVTQSGEITLSTGSTANSTARYETVRNARKITGTTNQFRAVARNLEAPSADCIRRIGAYDDNNGFFFQFDGTTFEVVSRKNGTDTTVSNGSFNGNAGATLDFGSGVAFTRVVIEYTALSARFFINGELIHTISAITTSLTNTLNLPARAEIINENGNTDDNGYEILFATIVRLGELETESEYKFINTNTTTVCKYNAGRLKRILNVDNAGSVTIYDNTVASGTLIATIDTGKALGTLDFDIPFSDGLTVVTATGAKVVVVYE